MEFIRIGEHPNVKARAIPRKDLNVCVSHWEVRCTNILIEKTKIIEVTRWNINHLNKIQECQKGDFIEVEIHLLGDSHHNEKVLVVCDYCEKETQLTVATIKRNRIHEYNNKHACKDCMADKRKETNLFKYGVDNPMKVEEFKENLRVTNQEIYGVDNVFQNKEIQRKSKKTIQKRYGVEHIMHIQEIKDVVLRKSRKTMMSNGTVNTSRQQLYLNNLYGGELNFAVDRLLLDVAFPKEKIYIEYNGGGHDLSVKVGRLTQDEYEAGERRRFHLLRSWGWRCFIINSPRDYLPTDEHLLNELENARQSFKNGKFRYTISLEDKVYSETYGTMRAIV